MQPLIKY